MLQASRHTLETLALKRDRHVGCFDTSPPCSVANLDTILRLNYPALKYLHLAGAFMVSSSILASFLARHPHLEEFHMPFNEWASEQGRETHRPNEWWIALFKALKSHPGLRIRQVRFRFIEDGFGRSWDDGEEERKRYPKKDAPRWCWDLEAYLQGEGVWTETLVERYGMMV